MKLDLSLPTAPCLPVAADVSRAFVRELSRRLLHEAAFRAEPALVALGYWFRDAAVERWLNESFPAGRCFVPRGTVFHIPPGNVETNYLYVWLLSVLVGNRNVVRVPSRTSTVGATIESLLDDLLQSPPFSLLRAMNSFVRYQHEEEITAFYSQGCDLRVVSGSDATVQAIRRVPLPATAVELNFVAKSSFAVLDVEVVCQSDQAQIDKWTRGLWQDIVGFDQLACNSPRAVWWLGANHPGFRVARERFWNSFAEYAGSVASQWSAAGVVLREGLLDRLGLSGVDAQVVSSFGDGMTRVWLPKPMWADDWFGGSGVLFETAINELSELSSHLSRRQQTVASLGVSADRWRSFLAQTPASGIDRIVSLGQSLTFAAVWDGFDLGRMLTREIAVP